MTTVVMHPRAIDRGVINARAVLRTDPAYVTRADVLAACEVLMHHGDATDYRAAQMMIDALELEDRAMANVWPVGLTLFGWAVAAAMVGYLGALGVQALGFWIGGAW